MGVLEEVKERLVGIQCKVQRVYEAGKAVERYLATGWRTLNSKSCTQR